jgi:carbon-monoxide dehydrogenase small subunit
VVPHPPAAVWQVLGDLKTTSECLPGAELTEHDARSAKGRIKIKFGPMSAAFNGAATLERDDAQQRATFRGAGTDSLSGSRARGDIAYRLVPEQGGAATRVHVTLDYSLVGPLAQFSRSGLVKDFAGRLIAEFGKNLSARIAAPASQPLPPAEMKAGSMFLGVLWRRLLALFGIK